MPITPYIQSKLAIALLDIDSLTQIKLYRDFAVNPSFRGMTGSIFEAFCHSHFRKRISVECVPMVRPDGDGRKRRSQWHANHRSFSSNKKLEATRQAAVKNSITLEVRPSDICMYGGQDLAKLDVQPGIYYISKQTNEVGLDSFILHDDHLYLFQFTIGKRHGISEELIPWLTQCTQLPPRSRWYFIFVIPDDNPDLECPYPRSPVMLFSSLIVMEEYRSRTMGEAGSEAQHSEPAAQPARIIKAEGGGRRR
jgi:hypothetical protein